MHASATILICDDAWRLACARGVTAEVEPVDHAPDAGVAEKARACAARLRSLGVAGPVAVALPSSWCLSAAIQTDALGRGPRRKAMAYLLEEHLPVSAEDSVADYIEHAGRALGVCVELVRLRPVIDALAAEGVQARHAAPLVLFAAEHALQAHPLADAVLIIGADPAIGADLIELDHARPSRWSWLIDDAAACTGRLDTLGDALGRRPRVIRLPHRAGETDDRSSPADSVELITPADLSAEQAAALYAARLLAGATTPWVELRREALAPPDRFEEYRRPLGALAAAAVFLLFCAMASTYWLGERYDAAADRLAIRQEQLFREVMPGQRPPASIPHRLASERRKLAGLGGQAVDASAEDAAQLYPTPALTQLHAVLSALPPGLRFVVTDLQIDPEQVRVEGRAPSPTVAEQLAASLRDAGTRGAAVGYQVDPANAYQDERSDGVHFDFVARPLRAQPATSEGRP